MRLSGQRVAVVGGTSGIGLTDARAAASEERRRLFEKTSHGLLVGRIGAAEEVAQTCLYLMTNEFSTGTSVTIDGGAV